MSKKEPRIDYVRMYLREIGRLPLLTREQEIEYGQQVQQMMLLLEVQSVLAQYGSVKAESVINNAKLRS